MAVALPCIAQFVLVLDVTIVAIALPAMQADLALSTTALGWVVTAYTLAFGCCLLAAGRLADRVGRRRGFVAGLVLFAAASLACGLAPSGGALLAARAVQGLGAAIASPAALALVTAARPEARGRARALGWWTAAAAGGGASGWVLGGLLTGVLDWRWVFLVNVPLCAAAAALAPIVLRERRDPSPGRSLLRTLLARPGVAGPNVVAAVITATTTPPLFLCTLHVQNVLGLAPGAAGLLFPPVNLAVVAGSLGGPSVAAAVGERRAMTGGLLAVAAGALALLAIAPGAPALPSLLGGFVLLGLRSRGGVRRLDAPRDRGARRGRPGARVRPARHERPGRHGARPRDRGARGRRPHRLARRRPGRPGRRVRARLPACRRARGCDRAGDRVSSRGPARRAAAPRRPRASRPRSRSRPCRSRSRRTTPAPARG